ncbi:unnamed protein product [Cercopithifilaria johnstoni]|uniref:Uncharacterized protein n=1 Tax=Cercopithifilaria johnstoni TaxID=2874296 RepID=A0A8J2PXZ3_9BILA|nr:unnamed protein product [Cercopithifilaria johnstoni]
MDIHDYSLINRNPSNTRNGRQEISFGENGERNGPSSSSASKNTLRTFMKDDTENDTYGASMVNLPLARHEPRSRTRKSDPLRMHNCNDCLPPLETEQQFRVAVTKCARGGDSMEPGTGMAQEVPNLSPLILKTKPIIISSSPIMKVYSFAKEKRRKTAAEIDAFFTRLSTPKHINGKVSKEKKIGAGIQQMSIAQRRSGEATKGLRVNVVRTRSNSSVRSGTRP